MASATQRLDGVDEPAPLAFFENAYENFLAAEKAVGTLEQTYAIGGSAFRLRFAGDALVPCVSPALEHLAADPGPTPSLTVCVWDAASTGVEFPSQRVLPRYLRHDRVTARCSRRRIRAHLEPEIGLLSLYDAERGLALYSRRDVAQHPYRQESYPLITILSWWAPTQGYASVHAGAVGTPEAAVLIVGRSGSGKSTTALSCLNSGLLYLADDHCLLDHGARPFVYSLYNSGRVEADHLRKLPHLLPAVSINGNSWLDKAIIFVSRHYPSKISAGLPVRAVLAPVITGRPETRVSPLSAVAALRAFVPSTLFQFPDAGPFEFEAMARLAQSVPCYSLELGTNIDEIPGVIQRLLES